MTEPTLLVTRAQRNAATNRDAFVEEARNGCAAFGSDLEFDRIDWDVTEHCPRPAGKAGQRAVFYFATHDNGTKKGAEERTPLPEPFGSVLKAIIRLKKEGNPSVGDGPLGRIVVAARYLAPLLADRGYDPSRLVPQDLDDACKAVVERGGQPTTHYRLGQALQEIVTWLARRQILMFPFAWKNSFKRISSEARIGASAEANRKKMVEEDVLDELARLSHLVTGDSDRMLMAATKLFHCAPWRVGEVNTIPDNCWVEQPKIGAAGPLLNEEGNPVVRCGIRYWPEKSKQADIKWLPDVMVPVARSAIETLIEVSAPARDLARWYETHLGRAWLPGPDMGPRQTYTVAEVEEMFGLSSTPSARAWLQVRGVPINGAMRPSTVSRADLELVLLKQWHGLDYLTKDRRGLKRSQHLFLTIENLHSYRNTNPCSLSMTTDQHISDFLSGRGDEGKGQVKSVFERFESRHPDGIPMRVNTHKFRHWLNTMAQRGGMSQVLVARWSGREDISQNAEYDHMSGVELAEVGRGLMASGQVQGALADLHDRLDPVEREGFRQNVLVTAHVTDLGLCDHDYFSAPCPELSFDGCSVCEHLNVKKGDQVAQQRAQRNREDTEWLLERAIDDMEDGAYGASNFVEAHTMRLQGLDRIIAIHDDPDIPDGTWVRSTPESPAHFNGPALRESE